ncbi:MAG: hypothetical protein KUG78_04400 [Kangiellaceae bacterium]|nr:hypothetical protein [Kangiellaceae bacterium]
METNSKVSDSELDKYRPKVNFREVFKFVIDHPGLSVFLVYATIAIAGFIYLVIFYNKFELQVTTYLEVTDILVAGIKDPWVMLMILGSFTLVLLIWIIAYIQAPFSVWLDRKFDKGLLRIIPRIAGVQSTRSFWWTALVILSLYFYMFIGLHAINKADSILNDKQHLIVVDSEATTKNGDQFSLLGTSINYVFLYNHRNKATLIVPLENIKSLQPVKKE